jgi:molybdopterin synthase catalytic subunit
VVVFKIFSKIGKTISLDEDRWRHVLNHPEMKTQLDRIKETIMNPDEIRESTHDPSVLLFCKLYGETPVTEKYLLVVIETQNREGFIVTAFFTDRVKKGGVMWKKKP